MKKCHYDTKEEREQILQEAMGNGWVLKEEAKLINERYLLFDTKIAEKTIELQKENIALSNYMLDVDFRLTIKELGL